MSKFYKSELSPHPVWDSERDEFEGVPRSLYAGRPIVEMQNPPIICATGDISEEAPKEPETMTVAQLIAALAVLPLDATVYVSDDSLWRNPEPKVEDDDYVIL